MYETRFFTQKTRDYNGRHVWLRLVTCEIGYIWIVQYEKDDLQIETFIYFNEEEKAHKKFEKVNKKVFREVNNL